MPSPMPPFDTPRKAIVIEVWIGRVSDGNFVRVKEACFDETSTSIREGNRTQVVGPLACGIVG
jgi:hypothetical protein